MSKPPVDWICNLRSADGYGKHTRGMIFNLPEDALNLSVIDKSDGRIVELTQSEQKQTRRLESGHLNNPKKGYTEAIEVWHLNPWSASNLCMQDPNSYHCDDVYKILFTVYESPEIPVEWTGVCDRFDEIWTPSHHSMKAFARSKIRDDMHYEVIPEAPGEGYTEGGERAYDWPEYTFLSVFDFTLRKGWDVLLRAYCEEFDATDDVRLAIKTHYGASGDDEFKYVQSRMGEIVEEYSAPPQLGIIWDWIPEQKMPALYRSADCFVLPTRGEGWGLPLCEAAACGVPVITTKHFAPKEFLDNNTYWIEVDGLKEYPFEEAIKHEPNCAGLPFAEPSVDSLRKQMRSAYEDGDEAVSPDVSDLSWEDSAESAVQRLCQIWERG